MQETIPWTLDLQHAKRAMWLLSFKIWLFASVLWGAAVLYLSMIPATAALHIDEGGIFIFFVGSGLFFPSSIGLGLRRWLYYDARMFWRDPVTVIAMIQTSADAKVPILYPRFLRIPKYWNYLWDSYWEERTRAIQEMKKSGQLVGVPPKIETGQSLSTVDRVDPRLPMETFMTRPLRWYEVSIATMLVFLLLGLMISVCPTTTSNLFCHVLLDRHWLTF